MTDINQNGTSETAPGKCVRREDDDDDGWWPQARQSMHGPVQPTPAVQKLKEKLNEGILTVWAVLFEDGYETSLGDGYYAYVEQVFLRPTQAAEAVELAEQTRDHAGFFRWHIRRYTLQLRAMNGGINLRPYLSDREPTTVDIIAEKLAEAGLL